MQQSLARLHTALGFNFKQPALLAEALSHRSCRGRRHNERLEFLGDAVLNLIVAGTLYRRHPSATEGTLSHSRAALVCKPTLVQLAQQFELGRYLKLGAGERKGRREARDSLLADAMEAIIGAIYLEGGLAACERCLHRWYGDRFEQIASQPAVKDPKTQLQEAVQALALPLPKYILVDQEGAAHQPTFRIVCEVTGVTEPQTGTGNNRRQAEQAAAARMLVILNQRTNIDSALV